MHEKLFFRHTFVTLNVRDHNPEHRQTLIRKNKTSVFVMKQAHHKSHFSHRTTKAQRNRSGHNKSRHSF